MLDRLDTFFGRFYEAEHLDWKASVSTITGQVAKPGLLRWYGALGTDEAIRQKELTAEIGTEVHNYVHGFGKGINIEPEVWKTLCPETQNSLRAYVRFNQDHPMTVIDTERQIIGAFYAGTLDRVAQLGKKYILIDWKTGRSFYPEYDFQSAAYAKAWEQNTKLKISETWSVLLNRKTGNYELRVNKDLKLAYKGFLGCYEILKYGENFKNTLIKEILVETTPDLKIAFQRRDEIVQSGFKSFVRPVFGTKVEFAVFKGGNIIDKGLKFEVPAIGQDSPGQEDQERGRNGIPDSD